MNRADEALGERLLEATEATCHECGDTREPGDPDFGRIVSGEPCDPCRWKEEGLCRGCGGENIQKSGLCPDCSWYEDDDWKYHRDQ